MTSPSVENLIAPARRSGMAFEYLSTGRGTKLHGAHTMSVQEERSEYQHLTAQQKRLLVAFDRLALKQRAPLLELLDSILPRRA